jgi:hypothetical protein
MCRKFHSMRAFTFVESIRSHHKSLNQRSETFTLDVTAQLLLFIVTATVLLLQSARLQATVIVMIQIKDGYWIGADGVRGEFQVSESVCKIHESRGWLILKSGAAQSWDRDGKDYSVDDEVERLAEKSESITRFENDLNDLFHGQEVEIIRWLIAKLSTSTISESDDFALQHIFTHPFPTVLQEEQVRNVTIIGYDSDQLVNMSLTTAPISSPDTRSSKFPYRYGIYSTGWVPNTFAFGPLTILSYPTAPYPKPTHSGRLVR